MKLLRAILLTWALWLPMGASADAMPEPPTDAPRGLVEGRFAAGEQHLGVVGGYGLAFGRSSDSLDIEDVRYGAVATNWGIGLTNPLGGDAWYRGNLEAVVEGTVLFQSQPSSGHAAGGGVQLRYNWLRFQRVVPFLSGGAGMLDLDFDLESQSDGFNFLLQAGVGAHVFVSKRMSVTAEWRYQHISNAGTQQPNSGIDAGTFLLGTTFYFD